MLLKDYIEETRRNIVENIPEFYSTLDEVNYEQLFDWLWDSDAVTGAGSESYTMNRSVAEENIRELLLDSEFLWEIENHGENLSALLEDGPETVDVTARCYALDILREDLPKLSEEAFGK